MDYDTGLMPYLGIIDKYYESGSRLREILIRHSRQVAALALRINDDKALGLDPALVEAAAMLHDIGIFMTNAPDIECHGSAPYLQHGILGAQLLRAEGAPECLARVAERHTGSGITADEIARQHLPLPQADYLPESMLEQLICYSDKFYSKSGDMQPKTYDDVLKSMKKFGSDSLQRFQKLHNRFASISANDTKIS